jgi:hypothetical protein
MHMNAPRSAIMTSTNTEPVIVPPKTDVGFVNFDTDTVEPHDTVKLLGETIGWVYRAEPAGTDHEKPFGAASVWAEGHSQLGERTHSYVEAVAWLMVTHREATKNGYEKVCWAEDED